MNVGVFFGGASCEHEISIITALEVINVLKNKYTVLPVYISKDSNFYLLKDNIQIDDFKEKLTKRESKLSKGKIDNKRLDIAVLCVHGTNVEDGKLTSLLDYYDIVHTSSSHTSLAICQDKLFMKDVLKSHNIRVLEETKEFPCIVKPANLGSSIGIKVAYDLEELKEGQDNALKYDRRILIERYLPEFREINIGVIADGKNFLFSNLEEVFHKDKILSYQDKYLTKKTESTRKISVLDRDLEEKIKKIAEETCLALDVRGIIRIDFLVSDQIYVNEINSIPGSMAHYLFDISYLELLEKLMRIALKDHEKEKRILKSFQTNILDIKGKK